MCVSVLTQTRPWPPPGAGALFAACVLAPPAGAGADVVAAAPVEAEVLGLNKSLRVNLPGEADGDGLAAAEVFARARFALGEPAGDAAGDPDGAGLAEVVVSVFL